jgi:cellulose synthase/poly-beta-1,6-N-acetylglucosamine synthase-like glycosyltransferase
MSPFISIIVPTKNNEKNIGRCLNALKFLNYPKEDYEIIVVDGCSSDRTPEIARKYGAKIVSDDGKGRALALNAGVDHAIGDYIAFTDADCVPDQDWIRNSLKYFLSDDVAGVGGPNVVPTDTNSLTHAIEYVSLQSPYAKRFESIGNVEAIAGCNSIYRANLLRNFMPLPMVGYVEDLLLNYRIRKRGLRIVSAPDAIVWHYRHYSSFKSFFIQMISMGKGEIQGVRLEKGLYKPLHKVEGLSLPIFLSLFIILYFVSKLALTILFILIFGILFALFIKCLVETKSLMTSIYVPPVALLQGLGYSIGYITETIYPSSDV